MRNQLGGSDAESLGNVAAQQEDEGADEGLLHAPPVLAVPHPVAPPFSGLWVDCLDLLLLACVARLPLATLSR